MSSILAARKLLWVFRWGIFLLACVFLWWQLRADKGMLALQVLRGLPDDGRAMMLVASALVLVPVNWGIESWKWRRLVQRLEPLRPWRAFLATVAGTSIGLVTPNRTGEFLGRVLFLKPGDRVRGGFATALGSIAQFVITLLAGVTALVALLATGHPLPWPEGWYSAALISLTCLVAAGTLVLYLFPALMRGSILALPVLRRLERPSAVLNTFRRIELLEVLTWSALRYAVFTFQYLLLCEAFRIGVAPMTTMLVVPVIYLVATIVPTVLLTEIGVRGSAALAFFTPLGAAPEGVLLATSTLWAINLVLPAAVGGVVLVTARIRAQGSDGP
ncbi:MAG: flippase-like domain-containing protein [Flavobacteriales bacterium]|nr:flippase-like domain-containing protein [Flavobacteriales bacterium]